MAGRTPLFLYSTNVFMKFLIQEQYQGGKHYVWCSEHFDPTKLASYDPARKIPPSSNPAMLYRRYKEDFESDDTHSSMINSQKSAIITRAGEWFKDGKITSDDFEEIVFLVDKNRSDWRPVIYVIRRDLVEARLEPVAAWERAGVGMEYRIKDLTWDEFELMEV
jgi:hypothetical protein